MSAEATIKAPTRKAVSPCTKCPETCYTLLCPDPLECESFQEWIVHMYSQLPVKAFDVARAIGSGAQ